MVQQLTKIGVMSSPSPSSAETEEDNLETAQSASFSHRNLTILFGSLLLDLVAFTVILPLLPSLLDYYGNHDDEVVVIAATVAVVYLTSHSFLPVLGRNTPPENLKHIYSSLHVILCVHALPCKNWQQFSQLRSSSAHESSSCKQRHSEYSKLICSDFYMTVSRTGHHLTCFLWI